jgi:hypothetical protein
VRDDRPFGGRAPPAAVFFYSPDRTGIHPERHLAGYAGILQADAYAGFNALYASDRKGGPTATSTRFVPAMSDGARSIPKPIGAMTFSTRARLGSLTCLTTSARRACGTL